jgi:uncharacterized protein YbaA (DUF1428 family)
MSYIDGFVLPISPDKLTEYRAVSVKVAEIWKEQGALDYQEYVKEAPDLEGTRSFPSAANATEHETVIFGWVSFESREARDLANQKVANDPRMAELVAPLTDGQQPIFDARRMMYGGFNLLLKA